MLFGHHEEIGIFSWRGFEFHSIFIGIGGIEV